MRNLLLKQTSVFFALTITASTCLAQTYAIADYLEGDFDYHKWFGNETQTLRVRAYTPHTYTWPGLIANWDLHESTGPYGGPLEGGTWTSEPFKHMNTWHMYSASDGAAYETGDSYPDRDCTLVYDWGKEIRWGTGDMSVGQLYENQLHSTGSCGENWGWTDVKILNHHSTYTIPAVSASSWSCPQAEFSDVLEIRLHQWSCDDASCSSQTLVSDRYWLAKGFGAIKLWGDNGYVIRRLFDEDDTSISMCAADWIAANS
jgi:hypothetical protein